MEVDNIVLEVMENNGFDRDQVQEQIEKNRHNVMTTTYYLLLKKKIRMHQQLDDNHETFKKVRLDMAIVIDAEMISNENEDTQKPKEEEKNGKNDDDENEVETGLDRLEIPPPEHHAKKLATPEDMKQRSKRNKTNSVKESVSNHEAEVHDETLGESSRLKRTVSSKKLPDIENRNDDIFSTLDNLKDDTSKEGEITLSHRGGESVNETGLKIPVLEEGEFGKYNEIKENAKIEKFYDFKEKQKKNEILNGNKNDEKINSIFYSPSSKIKNKLNFERRKISGLENYKESNKNWDLVKGTDFLKKIPKKNIEKKNTEERTTKTSNKKLKNKKVIKSINSDKNFKKKFGTPSISTRLNQRPPKKIRPKSPSYNAKKKTTGKNNFSNISKTLKHRNTKEENIVLGKKSSIASNKEKRGKWKSKLDRSNYKKYSTRTVDHPFKSKMSSAFSGTKKNKRRRRNINSHLIKYRKKLGKNSPTSFQKAKGRKKNKSLKFDKSDLKTFFRAKEMKTERERSKKKKIGKMEGGSDGVLSQPRITKSKSKAKDQKAIRTPKSFSKKKQELMMLMKGKNSKPSSRMSHKKHGKLSVSMLNKNYNHFHHNFEHNTSNNFIGNPNTTFTANFHHKDSSFDETHNSSRYRNKKKKLRKRLKIRGRNNYQFSGIRSMKVSPKGHGRLDFKSKKYTHDNISFLKKKNKGREHRKKNKEIYMSLLLSDEKSKTTKKSISFATSGLNHRGLDDKRISFSKKKIEIRKMKRKENGKSFLLKSEIIEEEKKEYEIDLSKPLFDEVISDNKKDRKKGPLALDFLMVLENNEGVKGDSVAKIIEESEIPLPHLLKKINFQLIKPETGGSCVLTCALADRKNLNFMDQRVVDSYRNFEDRLREVF